tara:strand:- start:155 stop:610 length:456 start_codon:yes stop_codon:yes gene_type:complete
MPQKNISCPNCAKQFSVLENLGGQKTECIFCKHKLTIPNFDEDIILPDYGLSKRYYTNLILTIIFIIFYAASISLKGAAVLLVITIIFLFALKAPPLICRTIGFVLFALDIFWLYLWQFTNWNLFSEISGVGIGIILIFGIISGGILLWRS